MQGKTLNAIVTIIVGFAMVFTVNAYQIDCPKSIDVREKMVNMPEGWDLIGKSKYADASDIDQSILSQEFWGINVYLDDPAVIQEPDQRLLSKKNGVKKYQFIWEVEQFKPNENFYVRCDYSGSRVKLVQKIDSSMKSCWIFYSEDKYGKEVSHENTLYCSTNKAEDVK
ncbi:STY0301 family protein [Gilliamella sp. wkB171]|uniref:STY0301 family protein n=1 Tax=Gilliamella sp. wkB171 TaxID=3120258 RepID=UPI0008133A7E|nr:STY0301 family protein [Gilliamella apicola]OCL19612.1 hypothetical protein A9G03_07830 [Gilliamella apicola]